MENVLNAYTTRQPRVDDCYYTHPKYKDLIKLSGRTSIDAFPFMRSEECTQQNGSDAEPSQYSPWGDPLNNPVNCILLRKKF